MAELAESTNAAADTDARPRVMVMFAHPDDAEFICSGTVARFVQAGYRVHYVLATSGDKGSHDLSLTPKHLGPSARRSSLRRRASWAWRK